MSFARRWFESFLSEQGFLGLSRRRHGFEIPLGASPWGTGICPAIPLAERYLEAEAPRP
jgi:hypothetical protein